VGAGGFEDLVGQVGAGGGPGQHDRADHGAQLGQVAVQPAGVVLYPFGVRRAGRRIRFGAGQVAAEARGGAAVARGVAVCGGEVGRDEVVAGGGQPGALGLERLGDRLGDQCVLRGELLVEAAVGQAHLGHHVGHAHAGHAAFPEHPGGRLDDAFPVLLCLCLRNPSHDRHYR
jgi:hypothetical protein